MSDSLHPPDPPDPPDGYLFRFLSAAFASAEHEGIDVSSAVDTDPDEESVDPELLGRYPVAELLGRGGVGLVYRAHDPDLGREIAIKVLRRELADDPRAVERFLAEARLSSTLQHPGIVPIHELGRLDDGRPYFTMKIVDGETLDVRLRIGAEEGSRDLIQIFGKICEAVAFVHSHGVIHADLKPQNIMVGAFGEVQVMDFGFARVTDTDAPDDVAAPRSFESRVAGTPSYMAPEQARGDVAAISPRTDVFGLGAILLEILTGSPPFPGQTRSEILLRTSKGWIQETLDRIDREVDPSLRELLKDCLAVDPLQRPENAGRVARRVAHHLASLEERVRRSELDAAEARAEARQEKRVRRLTVLLAAATTIAILVPAALFIRGERQRNARRATADRAVGDALARAAAVADVARADSFRGGERWAEALVAARLAEARAAAPDAGDELRGESTRLRATIEAQHAAAVERRRIVEGLARLHPHGTVEHPEEAEAGYHAAFRELGVDPDGAPAAEVAARVAESSASTELLEALIQWTYIRRRHLIPDEHAWIRPLEVAISAEPDRVRRDVLRAFRDGDEAELLVMASGAPNEPSLHGALGLLARCLAELGAASAAISLYRLASFDRPDDYWSCHDLASQLIRLDDPPFEEVVRLYSMALALRPESPHALTDLGRTLSAMGDATNAEPLLRRAVAADPEDGRAQFVLGMVLAKLEDFEGAIAILAAALENGQPEATLPLVTLLVERGRLGDARAARRRGTSDMPKQKTLLVPFCKALFTEGDLDGAERFAREAVERSAEPVAAFSLLGAIHVERGEFDDAEEAWARANELAPDPATRSVTQAAFQMVDASRAAVEALPGAEARLDAGDPFEFDLESEIVMLGVTALRIGRTELAARLYLLVAETEPRGRGSVPFWARASQAAARHALALGTDRESDRATWIRRAFAWNAAGVRAAHEGARTGASSPADALSEIYVLTAEASLLRLHETADLPDEADGWSRAVDRATEELAGRLERAR